MQDRRVTHHEHMFAPEGVLRQVRPAISAFRDTDAMDANVSAFLAVAALVILTPGPDTALVTKSALLYGRRAALATSAGVNVGLLV